LNPEKHVTILGILHIAFGGIFLLVGLAAFAVLSGIGVVSGDETALGILGLIGTAGFVFFLTLGLPGIIGGIGLLNYQPWARILVLVIGCLHLFDVPLGTALGIYTIWALTDENTRKLFVGGQQVLSPQAL
jgi:hypothetical protein